MGRLQEVAQFAGRLLGVVSSSQDEVLPIITPSVHNQPKPAITRSLEPDFPRAENFYTVNNVTSMREKDEQYRPLIGVYAPGLYEGLPDTSAYYKSIQEENLRIEWKTVLADKPSDPTVIAWKRNMYSILQQQVHDGNDIYLFGHSAGGALIISLAVDMVTDTEFYNPELASHIRRIIAFAPPNVFSKESITRPAIEGKIEYHKLFGKHSPGQIQQALSYYQDIFDIFVASRDEDLLRAEGITLAKILNTNAHIINTDHGMNGDQAEIRRVYRDRVQFDRGYKRT